MSSVTNMILHRWRSRSMAGFVVRVASRNCKTSKGTCGVRLSAISVEDGSRHRNLSTCTISTHGLGADCHFFSPISTQRRLRSALPDDDYYDYEDESDAAAATMTRSSSSSKPFLLADIGEGIAEVELLRWFVEEGQAISEFDPVCEVQSDKATVEITSRYEGTVERLAYQSTGSMIKVGEPILWIVDKEEAGMLPHDLEEQQQQKQEHRVNNTTEEEPLVKNTATSTASLSSLEDDSSTLQTTEAFASMQEPRSTPEPKQQPFTTMDAKSVQEQDMGDVSVPIASKKVLTSPAVRKLVRENGLDLSTITGTGPADRILKGDILAILRESGSSTETEDSSMTAAASTASVANGLHEIIEEWNCPLREDVVVPLRGYNRIMADTMAASLKIPHMVYSDEINLNRFVRYKMEQQQLDHHNHHIEISKKLLFLPLAIKAASKALEAYPWLNASFDDEKYEATLWKDHNIGIAMDTPRGLIVPVIKECQNKSLPELAEELKHLKASVMEGGGGLPANNLKGATFTLSNVGAIGGGGTYMSPIITPPQVAIGALGQIRRLPRFVTPSSTDPAQSQTIEEAHICAVSWAADHRVVDGATVARFHKSFKEYMEDPIKLLLELR
jgi:2-oxoisovalerate dehydrogenase E2 component (dihydrolipoyl transacylase)